MSSARRSNARSTSATRKSRVPFTVPKTNTKTMHTVMSVLRGGPDLLGKGFLGFLDPKEQNALAEVNEEFYQAVTNIQKHGFKDIAITGPLSVWRRKFPKAKYANISERQDLNDADFIYLDGVKEVNIASCNLRNIGHRGFSYLKDVEVLNISNSKEINHKHMFVNLKKLTTLIARNCTQLTNKTFEETKGLKVLDIAGCYQISDYPFINKYFENLEELNISYCNEHITNDAFVHLKNLKVLNMASCTQREITDDAFTHLEKLHTLNIKGCHQNTITDNAFKNLHKLTTLDISYCTQFTRDAFNYFKNIKKLTMLECTQNKIDSFAFRNLQNIEDLDMGFCASDPEEGANKGIKEDMFNYLPNPAKLKKLDISFCYQFTDDSFKRFEQFINLRYLDMKGCGQRAITDEAFKQFDKITTLNMTYCIQNTITSEAFNNLKSIENLRMVGCKQDTIGDIAFKHLGEMKTLKMLDISYCNQHTITDKAFTHLTSLLRLEMPFCNQKEITGATLTRENLPKLNFLRIYNCNKSTENSAETNLGVTSDDPIVKSDVGRTRYARTAKTRPNYSTLTRRN